MHYKIKNLVIKSEYAAKSVRQPSSTILKIINNLSKDLIVLDYGCGKLRYTIPLSKVVNLVYSIDSEEQLLRNQKINDVTSNIFSYANKYFNNVYIYDLKSAQWKYKKYDFVLCANVLSAVPLYEDRIQIIRNIIDVLKQDGQALITTQFYNSYFCTYADKKNSIKYYDGWIIKSKNYSSFYGMIGIKKLKYYARIAGAKIINAYTRNGSAYLTIGK